jgi:hypothetical protein
MTRASSCSVIALPILALVLCACQSGATAGAPCARRADCPDPLVCRLGRCRAECAADRDCPPGVRCFLSSLGGACELPAADLCDVAGACVPPLVCGSGHCSEPCERTSECGGGACVEGTCRLAEDDAGVGVPSAVWYPCVTDADCTGGALCVRAPNDTTEFACRPPCVDDADCVALAGPRSRCWNANTTAGPTTPVCSLPCALGQLGVCGSASGCQVKEVYPLDVFRLTGIAECGPSGPGGQGDSCFSGGCGDGLACVWSTTLCATLCSDPLGVAGPCPAGTRCQPYEFRSSETGPLVIDGVEWGLCAP